MSKEKQTVQVSIMGKRYNVICPADEISALNQAASHLNQHMQRIQNSGAVSTPERVAVLAALNMAHELLTERGDSLDYRVNVEAKMRLLSESMDEVLITAPSHREDDSELNAR